MEDVKEAEAGCERGDAQRRRLGRKVQEGLGTDCRGGHGAGASDRGQGEHNVGPLLGVCPRPPGSLPAGLTLESEPSHLRPETAAAHLDHTPRTVCRPPAGPCKGPPAPPTSRAPVPLSPRPGIPQSAQPGRRPRGLGTASSVPGVGRGSPDRVLEVSELASRASSWAPGHSDPGRPLTCSACGRSVSRGHILSAQVALDTRQGTLPGQGAAQWRWWSRPSPVATGQLCAPCQPHAWSWPGSRPAAPPGQPTSMGVPVTPATLPWLAAGRLSAPVAGQPFAGQGGVGRRVGQPWLLCLGQAGAFSASGWAACPGLQAVLHSLVARPRLWGPLADKTHLSEIGL